MNATHKVTVIRPATDIVLFDEDYRNHVEKQNKKIAWLESKVFELREQLAMERRKRK